MVDTFAILLSSFVVAKVGDLALMHRNQDS